MSPPPPVNRQHKAEIIDRLYDVAVDPIRFEDLVDVWEGRIGPLRKSASDVRPALDDSEIEGHFARASLFLDRFEATGANNSYADALSQAGRSAAFVCHADGRIAVANAAARQAFGLAPDCGLRTLPFEADDLAELGDLVRRAAGGRESNIAVTRLKPAASEGLVIARVLPVKSSAEAGLALVITSALVWTPGVDSLLQEAFGLTPAESEIVRAIAEGKAVRDIAGERGRSVDTVRTQLRSILAKTETHSQQDLVRITLAIMDTAGAEPEQSARKASPGRLSPLPFHTMVMPGARRYDWVEFGAPRGRPLLFLPLDYGFIRWPADSEAEAARRSIRVIVPVRAGFGHSGELPAKVNYTEETARDLARLMDHLGIASAPVLSLGADIRYAMQLAVLRPAMVIGIMACAGTLPIFTPAQYERMDKWQRFILANARYAPRLLPFLVKAGYALARRIGKEQFLRSVNAGSPGDLEIFDDPLVKEAILTGSEVSLSDWHSAHNAFARECIDSERDWAGLVRACPAPVVMLQGVEDPQSPRVTIEEQLAIFPHIKAEFIAGIGQLVFFKERARVLERLEAWLGG